MATYKLIFLIEQQFPEQVCFDFTGDYTEPELLAVARGLCDGLRALVPSACKLHYALLWQVDGSLSTDSVLWVYHRPEPRPQFTGSLIGAKQTGSFNQFTGLKLSKNTPIGKGVEKWVPGAVGPWDMAVWRPDEKMYLDPNSPAWSLDFPFFNAVAAQVPTLETVAIGLDGAVEDTAAAQDAFNLRLAQYHLKRHKRALSVSTQHRLLQSKVIRAAKDLQGTGVDLMLFMEDCDCQWGDNHVFGGVPELTVLQPAINATSIWYELARALGMTIPDDTANTVNIRIGGGFNNAGEFEGDSLRVFEHGFSPATWFQCVPEHFQIVGACVGEMYRCHVTLLEALRVIWETLEATTVRRQTADFILDLTTDWVQYYIDDNGDFRARRKSTENQKQNAGWNVVKFQSDKKYQAYREWMDGGGDHYGTAWYDLFPIVASAIHRAKKALSLLGAFMMPNGAVTPLWRKQELPGAQAALLGAFERIAVEPQHMRLIGAPCDWIFTKPPSHGPYMKLIQPSGLPTVADRTPARPHNLGAPDNIIDNSIVVDNKAQAIQVALVLLFQGHSDQTTIFWNDRQNSWAVGDPPDETPPGNIPVFGIGL